MGLNPLLTINRELTYKDTLFLNTQLKICVTIYFLSTFNKKHRERVLNLH